jgi:hypothetical protein
MNQEEGKEVGAGSMKVIAAHEENFRCFFVVEKKIRENFPA